RTISPLTSLGNLSKDKSKVLSIKGYPANTDVSVEYVFDGAGLMGNTDVADSRYTSLKVQHTILEVPQNNYKPRFEDYRIGYFETSQDVLTNSSATPYRDMIHRWHIEKKDPEAKLSEAKEPVVYWIENTTPLEFRPIIKAAGERWNRAFEKAGISNAIVIKEQSDTATWDAGDIRYNVLRWSTSPFPPFGGYGPSFVNPATGQILGADIIFDFAFVSNRLKQSRLLTGGYNEYEGEIPAESHTPHSCAIGAQMQHQFQMGATLLKYLGVGTEEQDRYLTESLHYLVLHEMGHTLGLMHNMKSSQFLSPAQLKDYSKTKDGAITGSVMDYPCVNLHPDGKSKVSFFTMTPGPYDEWAIEFGYSAALADSAAEVARLASIASRSTEAKLAFGNDADDMRGNSSGIDPRVMIDDLSSDGIAYAKDRLKLMKQLSTQLEAKLKLAG
ncbi:MAG: zinc-dependent metalloprotease, partial [Flexibacteraceae bacterium]